MAETRIWTISNVITLLRCILAIPITLMLISGDSPTWIILLFMVIAVLTDWFDGYFARKFNQVTELGKIIDPVADKIAVGVIAMTLTVQGRFSLWLFIAIILRDALILAGGIYISTKHHLVLQSNWMGKWAVTSIAMCLLLAVVNERSFDPVSTIFNIITSILLAGSFISYTQRFIRTIRTTPQLH